MGNAAHPLAEAGDFHSHLGLQLWSLRAEMRRDPAEALALARAYGFTEVELAALGDTPVPTAEMLASQGLRPIGIHYEYDRLMRDLPGVIRQARALGVRYVICPILPHPNGSWDEAAVQSYAADFNRIGAAFRAAGIRFAYHTHGAEFAPAKVSRDITAFDLLVRETHPEDVTYEMDVFWVYQVGQDPAALLRRHPKRWSLLHLKDLRRGAARNRMPEAVPASDGVPIGSGEIDWPAVLRAAKDVDVRHYFIEDPNPRQSLPQSLAYLRSLAPSPP